MKLKQQLRELVTDSLKALIANDELPALDLPEINIERTRQKEHGDFSCNAAMVLSKHARSSPRVLAQLIVDRLPDSNIVA